jgi:energy-coupling factor transporter ATP-binding protein EcfA2
MTVNHSSKFPIGLLKQPTNERLEYFRAFTVAHPLLLKAYEETRCAIRDSNAGSILFVQGPTGVGKTTLLKRLEKHLKEITIREMERDKERIPVVSIRLATPTSGNFDWKDYFKRLLLALEEPLVDYKVDMDGWNGPSPNGIGNDRSNMHLISSDRPGTRPMRFASEQTLRHRRPLAVLLDDAQHFGVISSGRKLLDQLNIIKSLADESQVTHVLCGTYELIPFRHLNGQLSRRSIDIHFGRYHIDDERSRQEYINLLYTFQQHLPVPKAPDLVSRWDYFYERSLGCVGVLKDWLTRSLALALDNDNSTLPLSCLERRALSVNQCATILREAVTGEKELIESEEERQRLRKNLGLGGEALNKHPEGFLASELGQKSDIRPMRRKRRVGARNPVRDKIGVR